MRQGGKDRAFAGLVRAYSAASGVSLRTAQRHAKDDHADGKAFVPGQAIGAGRSVGSASPVQATALAVLSPNLSPPPEPMEGRSEPEQVLRATHEMWDYHVRQWKIAVKVDASEAMIHAAATVKLREAYEKALKKYSQWEIEQRQLIPVSEFAAFRSEFVIPLAAMLRSLPQELAVECNPTNPGHALKTLTDYLSGRLQPIIQSLITNVESYTLPAA